jgi:hypothetical protein
MLPQSLEVVAAALHSRFYLQRRTQFGPACALLLITLLLLLLAPSLQASVSVCWRTPRSW